MTRTSKIVLIASLSTLALVVLVCGGLGYWAFQGLKELPRASASAELWLDQIGRGEVAQAYQSTSAEFRSKTTPEQFQGVIDRYPALAKATQRTTGGMRMNRINGRSYAYISYYLSNANNPLALTVQLVDEGGRWVVHGMGLPGAANPTTPPG